MIYEETVFTLKNGQPAVFRSPRPGEGEKYIDFLKGIAEESDFIMKYPQEINVSLESEENWISSGLEDPNAIRISCYIDGQLAGNSQIARMNRLKTAHRAGIAISVRKAYWRLGIGTKLMEEMLRLAHEWGVEQVELQYVEGNFRGKGLYEKMGFKEIGRIPNAFHLADGTSRAEVLMVYAVKPQEEQND